MHPVSDIDGEKQRGWSPPMGRARSGGSPNVEAAPTATTGYASSSPRRPPRDLALQGLWNSFWGPRDSRSLHKISIELIDLLNGPGRNKIFFGL
jgi:hypothetical protein